MAKSKIIKDIANGEVELDVSLKRAYIIASDIGNETMKTWIQKELSGYSEDDCLPEYRKLKGVFKVTYVMFGVQHKDEPMSLELLFGENKNHQNIYYCRDNIGHLVSASKDAKLRKIETVDMRNMLRRHVDSFFLEIPQSEYSNAVARVSEELLNLLLKIDKTLGNLDNLDVCPENEGKRVMVNEIINNYFGTIIKMGNNNEIIKSQIVGGDNDEK